MQPNEQRVGRHTEFFRELGNLHTVDGHTLKQLRLLFRQRLDLLHHAVARVRCFIALTGDVLWNFFRHAAGRFRRQMPNDAEQPRARCSGLRQLICVSKRTNRRVLNDVFSALTHATASERHELFTTLRECLRNHIVRIFSHAG